MSVALGCVVSGCSAPHPPDPQALQASASVRSGTVYLVRGLLGTFSTGMDVVREDLASNGIRAVAIQHTAGSDAASYIGSHHDIATGPVVLVGHSLGADEAIGMAKTLDRAGVRVDLLVTLDPILPSRVPGNVRLAINYHRSNGPFDLLPLFRGVRLKADSWRTTLANIDLNQYPEYSEAGTNHFNIDTNQKLRRAIVSQILDVCVPGPADAIMSGARLEPSHEP